MGCFAPIGSNKAKILFQPPSTCLPCNSFHAQCDQQPRRCCSDCMQKRSSALMQGKITQARDDAIAQTQISSNFFVITRLCYRHRCSTSPVCPYQSGTAGELISLSALVRVVCWFWEYMVPVVADLKHAHSCMCGRHTRLAVHCCTMSQTRGEPSSTGADVAAQVFSSHQFCNEPTAAETNVLLKVKAYTRGKCATCGNSYKACGCEQCVFCLKVRRMSSC